MLNNINRTELEGYIDGKRGRGCLTISFYDKIKEWTGRQYGCVTREVEATVLYCVRKSRKT